LRSGLAKVRRQEQQAKDNDWGASNGAHVLRMLDTESAAPEQDQSGKVKQGG
jgi:hypothetical protein